MKLMLRFVVVFCFAVIVACPSSAAGEMSFFDFLTNQTIGRPAADFTLQTTQGKESNMTQFRAGKKAIIFFWATWCPHCRVALKDLNQNLAQIEAKGIKIIPVDLGEALEEVRAYIQKNKIAMDIFLDKESSLAEPYNIIGVPTFYFVDEAGKISAVLHSLPKDLETAFSKSRLKSP